MRAAGFFAAVARLAAGFLAAERLDPLRRAPPEDDGVLSLAAATEAFHVMERLETGMVGLNRGLVSDPAAPFCGTKQSGLGREGSSEVLLEFMEAQYVATSW